MKIRKALAAVLAAAFICGAAASCSSKDKKSPDKAASAEPTTAPVPGVNFDEAVGVQAGDAYLAVVDSNWDKQYLGGTDEKNQLCYKAGVVHIDGNGD